MTGGGLVVSAAELKHEPFSRLAILFPQGALKWPGEAKSYEPISQDMWHLDKHHSKGACVASIPQDADTCTHKH